MANNKLYLARVARGALVLVVLLTMLFGIKVIQKVQAASQNGNVYGPNAAYPIQIQAVINFAGNSGGLISSSPVTTNCLSSAGTCTLNFNTGQTVQLAATPDFEPSLVQWVVDGVLDPTNKKTLDLTMDKSHAVIAILNKAPQYFATVSLFGTSTSTVTSDIGNINCGDVCGDAYNPNSVVTLTAHPAANEMLMKWVVNGVDSGITSTLALLMDKHQNVKAVFGTLKPRLSVVTDGAGSGTITSNPAGINCINNTGTCAALFAEDTEVILTAAPLAGSTFAGWNQPEVSPGATFPVTMNTSKTVKAFFDQRVVDLVLTMVVANGVGNNQLDYTVTVTNLGPDDITSVGVSDSFLGIGLNNSWTCQPSGTNTCTAIGSGPLSDTIALKKTEMVTYTIHRTWNSRIYAYTTTVAAPADALETNPANNSKTLGNYLLNLPVIQR